MAQDFTLPAAAAITKALKASAAYTALVPKAQIFDLTVPANPDWPFSRLASFVTSPFLASGLDSSSFRVTIQGFAKDTATLPAANNAVLIGTALAEVLDGQTLPLPGGLKLRLTWVQNQAKVDGDEAGAWMVSSIFNAEVAG